MEGRSSEISISSASLHQDQGNLTSIEDNQDLASTLKARIAQKKMENEMGHGNSGELLQIMMGALRDDLGGPVRYFNAISA